MSNEAWYDEHIAPALLDLARRCEEKGVGFLAVVEYAPDEFGETGVQIASDAMVMTHMAQRAMGNIDALAIGWCRRVTDQGRDHGSIVLKLMGLENAAADRRPMPRLSTTAET